MKEGWKYEPLGSVGKFKRGGNFKKSDFVDDGMPCVHYGQIHMTFGTSTNQHLSAIPQSIYDKCTKGEKGDLLIAITSEDVEGSCKCTAWTGDYAVALGGHMARFRHNLNPLYVSYFFQSPTFQRAKKEYTHGFKVVEIKPSDIAKITIGFPSPEEQAAIVSKLDTAFAKIDEIKDNAKRALDEAQAYLSSAISKALEPSTNWSQSTLKEVSLIAGNYGLSVSSKPFDGITRYLRITDISDWGELNSDIVSADISEVSSQNELIEGDLLFARTGATVGKTLMYMNSFGKCLFAGYLIRYRVNPEIVLPKFLFYITHSDSYYSWITMNQKVAAQPNISAKLYNQYIVNYPNTDKQKEIIAQLDNAYGKVVKLKENYNAIVRDCGKLKQSILHSIFE